jgi:hypothetical protein
LDKGEGVSATANEDQSEFSLLVTAEQFIHYYLYSDEFDDPIDVEKSLRFSLVLLVLGAVALLSNIGNRCAKTTWICGFS